MRILVVCGAGASSTFVAQRVTRAASLRGVDCTASAGTLPSLATELDSTDIVLIGPHLASNMDDIRREAEGHGVSVALLPHDVFADLDGTRTLTLALAAADREETP